MINEQVVWWIFHNESVYIKQDFQTLLNLTIANRQQETSRSLFRKVIAKLFLVMKQHLLQAENVLIDNLIAFYITNQSQNSCDNEIRPKHVFQPQLRKIIAGVNRQSQFQKDTKVIPIGQLSRETGSLLLIEWSVVNQIVDIFTAAVSDLVKTGKSVELDLDFCRINLDKSQANCFYRTIFIKELKNLSSKESKKSRYLSIYRHKAKDRCDREKSDKKSWDEVKEGNFFNRPSLREIKNHLDNGYRLQLKYKKELREQ